MWRTLQHYAHAFEHRSHLLSELKRAQKKGAALPKRIFWNTWRNPSKYDDRIPLLRFINPDEKVLLIDAGGNIGYWAEDFLAFFPKATLMGFEPVANSFRQYQSRFKNNPNVQVFNVALSDKKGEAEIHVSTSSTSSTLKGYEPTQDALNIQFSGTEKVKLDTLDSYDIAKERAQVSKIILKVDVQGNEVEVLKGAAQTLKLVDVALIECSFAHEHKNTKPSFATICKILLEYGLYPVIFRDYGRALSPYAWERDAIFVREDAIANIWGW